MAVHAQSPACYFPAEALGPGFLRLVGWHSRRVHRFAHGGNRTAAAIIEGAPLTMHLGEQRSCRLRSPGCTEPCVNLRPKLQHLCAQWLLAPAARQPSTCERCTTWMQHAHITQCDFMLWRWLWLWLTAGAR